MKIEKIIHYVNVPYHIANHVVGEHHTVAHRRVAGVFIMLIGVAIAHSVQHIGNIAISLVGDLIGYSIHGTGLIPFVHDLEANATRSNDEPKQNCETCLN